MDLARLGQVEWPTEPVDVAEVVEEVLADLGGLLVSTEPTAVKGHLPHVHVSRSLLFQIFDNLIRNALRYAGPQGGPIEVGGERQKQPVRYFVRDHGPGIPPAERSRIFEVFSPGSLREKLNGNRGWACHGTEDCPPLRGAALGGRDAWRRLYVLVEMMDDEPEMP